MTDVRGIDEIETDLLNFIRYQALGGRPLAVHTDLLQTEVLDPLLLHDLVEFIESTYEVRLQEREISPQQFRSVSCLAKLVGGKLWGPLGASTSVCRERDALEALCHDVVEPMRPAAPHDVRTTKERLS